VGHLYRMRGAAVLPLACFIFAAEARAESLNQALLEAYRKNPTLNAARAGQRATDENVPQALSGWRPTVSAQGSAGISANNLSFPTGTSAYTTPTSENLTIKLDQPLFRGFRTVEGTAVAEAQVKGGRQQLLVTEEQVLLNGVTAYVNVLRDRKILFYRQENLKVLRGQARATSERFKAGELTRTDVAQANAGVAAAQAALALAVANVKVSEAGYAQIIGHAPGKLNPAPLARPPASLEQAYEIAHETSPQILAAAQAADAAEHGIGVAKSGLLPQADLQGVYSFTATQNGSSNTPATTSSMTVQGVVTVPIYEGGLVYSQVRQARQKASQSRLSVIDATRQVRAAVATSWDNFVASKQAVSANTTAVSASQLAFDGVKQEYAVGSRSTVDVLNAEQTLLNAQIAVVSSQHDQLLGSYQLQSAIGHLTGTHLHLSPVYDAKEYYNDVHDKWIGTGAETLQ
jgi:outer membrane protein